MLVILSNSMLFIIFFPLTKISENSSAEYYQNNKKRLPRKACERYENLYQKEKHKKWQYCHEQYKNLPEDEKKAFEYRKCFKTRKNAFL